MRRVVESIACVILLSLITPCLAQAERATAERMRRVCENWLAYVVHDQGQWAGSTAPVIIDIQHLESDGVLLARNYRIAPRGHVLVPASTSLPPVPLRPGMPPPPLGRGSASPLPLDRSPPPHFAQTFGILAVQLVPSPRLKLSTAALPQASSPAEPSTLSPSASSTPAPSRGVPSWRML